MVRHAVLTLLLLLAAVRRVGRRPRAGRRRLLREGSAAAARRALPQVSRRNQTQRRSETHLPRPRPRRRRSRPRRGARQARRQPDRPGRPLQGRAQNAADRQTRRPRDSGAHPLGRAGRPLAEDGRARPGGRRISDHRGTAAFLVVPAGQGDGTAGRQGRRLERLAHRPLPPGEARGARPHAGRPRRQARADPPRHVRPDRAAADAGGDRRLPGRRIADGVREGGGPFTGVAGLRRALGPLLARRGPLRRHRRRDRRLPGAAGVPLPQLRHRLLQRRQAV